MKTTFIFSPGKNDLIPPVPPGWTPIAEPNEYLQYRDPAGNLFVVTREGWFAHYRQSKDGEWRVNATIGGD